MLPEEFAALKKRGNPGGFITIVYDTNGLSARAVDAFVDAAAKLDLPVVDFRSLTR